VGLKCAKNASAAGALPEPRWGAHDALPEPLVGWGGDIPSPIPTPFGASILALSALSFRGCQCKILTTPLTTGLTLGQTRKIHLDISPAPPLDFTVGQKVPNLASIFDTSRI